MGLHPTLVAIRRNLPNVARSQGFQARVTSAYRSRAAQTKLYNRYLAGLQPYPVAPPGTSDHEKGLALDVVSTDTDKLVSLLTSVGLSWAGEADPVHFSMIAPQIASQPVKKGLHAGSPVLFGLFTLERDPTPIEQAILNVENFLTFGLAF